MLDDESALFCIARGLNDFHKVYPGIQLIENPRVVRFKI